MIIFSSIKLEKTLADQKVTRWQKAKYIIIPAIFLSMASPLSAFFRPSFQDKPSTIYSVLQLLVHTPEQSGHPIRSKVDTQSGAKWTPNPLQSGQ